MRLRRRLEPDRGGPAAFCSESPLPTPPADEEVSGEDCMELCNSIRLVDRCLSVFARSAGLRAGRAGLERGEDGAPVLSVGIIWSDETLCPTRRPNLSSVRWPPRSVSEFLDFIACIAASPPPAGIDVIGDGADRSRWDAREGTGDHADGVNFAPRLGSPRGGKTGAAAEEKKPLTDAYAKETPLLRPPVYCFV